MAKLSFATGDGEARSYRLYPSRPTRIGRDPGNDIVLRDAKVSRSHAEVVFERGFFVLRDLASANGSYVNGTKVRTAPLVEGAEVRFGGSQGVFSEELAEPPSRTIATSSIGSAALHADGEPAGEQHTPPEPSQLDELDEPEPQPRPAPELAEEEDIGTAPHPKLVELDSAPPVLTQPEEKGSRPAPETPLPAAPKASLIPKAFSIHPFGGDPIAVRGDEGTPFCYVRRPTILIRFVANLLALLVFCSAIGVAALFATESIFLPAALALALGAFFTLLILWLTPTKTVTAHHNESLSDRFLHLEEERLLAVPRVRYRLEDNSGRRIASFRRSSFVPRLRRRWRIVLESGQRAAEGMEQSASDPLLRFLTLNFVPSLRPDYAIRAGGVTVAEVRREGNGGAHTTIAEQERFDREIILGFSLLVTTIDR